MLWWEPEHRLAQGLCHPPVLRTMSGQSPWEQSSKHLLHAPCWLVSSLSRPSKSVRNEYNGYLGACVPSTNIYHAPKSVLGNEQTIIPTVYLLSPLKLTHSLSQNSLSFNFHSSIHPSLPIPNSFSEKDQQSGLQLQTKSSPWNKQYLSPFIKLWPSLSLQSSSLQGLGP